MVSYAKSVGLLVIIAAVLCSSASGGIAGPALKFLSKLPNKFSHKSPKIPLDIPKPPKTPIFPNVPKPHPFTIFKAKKLGESLANKYFGDEFIKGFRWGYKQGKRIVSVARKCEDFIQVLEASSCPQPSLSNPLPGSAIVCIVEIANYWTINEICLQPYEKAVYPTEAICNLDQPDTLNFEYCAH